MKRYKLFLASGRALEIEAKAVRVEAFSPGGDRLVFRGDKNQAIGEIWLSNGAGYVELDSLKSEEGL